MKVTIFGHEFTTIASLKAFAIEQGIDTKGSSKWVKQQWIEAVTFYLSAQNNVVEMVVEADPIASEIAAVVEDTAVTIGTVVVKALASETAVLAYRVTIKAIAFALVMAWLLTVAAAKWCWEHRADTAIYHWIKDAAGSEFTLSAVTYMMLGEWVIVEWADSIRSAVTSVVQTCRVAWAGVQSRFSGLVEDARSVVG